MLVFLKKSLFNLIAISLIFLNYFLLIPCFQVIYMFRQLDDNSMKPLKMKRNRKIIKMTLRLVIHAAVVVTLWLVFSIQWLITIRKFVVNNGTLNSFRQITDPMQNSGLETFVYILFYLDPFIVFGINKTIREGIFGRRKKKYLK